MPWVARGFLTCPVTRPRQYDNYVPQITVADMVSCPPIFQERQDVHSSPDIAPRTGQRQPSRQAAGAADPRLADCRFTRAASRDESGQYPASARLSPFLE
ncbi:hypothetical protein EMIT093MI4_10066 [Pseudomonas sp. IT-93MI4]